MVDKLIQSEVDARRVAYLNGLYTKAMGGDVEAGGELSKIALGGYQMARDLVNQMDEKISGAPAVKLATSTKVT